MATSSDSANGERPNLPPIKPVGVDKLEKFNQGLKQDWASEALSEAEKIAITARRSGLTPPVDYDNHNLVGLALSGGGIRSATFCLGVMQALAAHKLLKYVDYLSTVSGGGYIGTSLLWWLTDRSGRQFGVGPWNEEDQKKSFPYGTDDPKQCRDRAGLETGPKLLRNLKEKGNYLTPGHGINILSLLAVVLRGVVLNLLFWVPVLATIFGGLITWHLYELAFWGAIGLAVLLVLSALVYSLMTGFRRWGALRRYSYLYRRWAERAAGITIAVALIAALIASIDLAHNALVGVAAPPQDAAVCCLPTALCDCAATICDCSATVSEDSEPQPSGLQQVFSGLFTTLAGLAAGLVTYFLTMRSAAGALRKLPGVTTNMFAIVATVFIIYGVLLFSHGLAKAFIDNGLGWWGLLVAGLLFVVSILTNTNHISVHRMYRDRLMEAFMPNFKEAVKGESSAAPQKADEMKMDDVDLANSPFPIINTNLVLVGSKERRRKLRGGDSFVLTPRYCGSNSTGWVDCRVLMDNRMTLPTAMAISGAAANPNTGAGGVGLTRSRVISVLMAFIGLRLGYWLPNFGRNRPPRYLPNHVWPGLSTVLPLGHKETSSFLELSDGGHFENLGLYELVRRRVRLIILCDAGKDPKFAFEDLQTAQRRIAADFGATLDLKPATLEELIPEKTDHQFPERDLKLAKAGHILGTIKYSDEKSEGTLIYLKTTLVECLPLALLGYRGANNEFPDQSTTDQFFDEEQFESYRELGYIIAKRMMEDPDAQGPINEVLGPNADWKYSNKAEGA